MKINRRRYYDGYGAVRFVFAVNGCKYHGYCIINGKRYNCVGDDWHPAPLATTRREKREFCDLILYAVTHDDNGMLIY
jgi:hypothetical protein